MIDRVQPGFSLIEALVVLAVIALVAVFAVPTIQHFFTHSQDELLQSQLLQAVQSAQQQARLKRVSVALYPEKYTQSMPAKTAKLYWRSYPQQRAFLLFQPVGLLANDNATFWYCRAQQALPVWAMMLSKSGRMRVVRPDQRGEIKDSEGKLLRCVDKQVFN